MGETTSETGRGGRRWPYVAAAIVLIAVVVALLLADDTSGLYEIRR